MVFHHTSRCGGGGGEVHLTHGEHGVGVGDVVQVRGVGVLGVQVGGVAGEAVVGHGVEVR